MNTPDDAFFGRMRDYLRDKADWFGMDEDDTIETMRDAFAHATAPPKPQEPTGLGAVVEDEQGNHWIRHGAGPKPWMLAGASPSNRDTYAYSTLPATKVLSPGVAQ